SASSAGQKDAQTIARKLSSAQAALEKATVEHTHVTQEITVLTRTLEQKRAQEEQHRREKTEAAAVLKEIEVEEERAGTASDHERERLEKEKAEAEHVEREKGRLLKEQAEVQDKLIKIEERAKQHGSEKRHHDEERRKAEEEAMREGNVIRDLERRAGILSRDIQSLEEGLRALEHKISRL
ncbi:MAG TPA: hypothetical protein VJ837_00285, partial [Candidatus Paceibacterota bacterium]|nr:hypothetical protein [Candidatus Paceibacterota bacterium]